MARHLLFTAMLLPMLAHAQDWHVYLNSTNVHDLDLYENTLLVGLDHRIARVNTTTLESELLMPDIHGSWDGVVPVRHVAIDHSGACWASVSSYGQGLWRWSNGTWTNFLEANSEMPDDLPQYLFADRDHETLWVTCNGTGSFDGTDYEQVATYLGPSTATSNGDLWTAADGFLYRYDGVDTQLFDTANSGLPHEGVYQLVADADDRIWFAMQRFDELTWMLSTTIGSYDGVQWMEYTDSTSALPLISEPVVDMCMDTNGTLVIATWTKLIEFDGVDAVVHAFEDQHITSLVIGADGTRWIGTATDGVLRMQNGGITTVDLGGDPLTGNRVYTVLVDPQGRVWCGTEHTDNSFNDQGIVMLDDEEWNVWAAASGSVPGSAYAMELDPWGNVFIAGGSGIYKRNANSWQQYCTAGGEGNGNSDIAVQSDGTAWLQSYYYTGLLQCDGNGNSTNLITPLASNMRCVEYDAFGELWVGKQGNLARRDPLGNWTVYDAQNALPLMGTINDIERDANGVVWVAGNDLYRFDGTTWSAIPNPTEDGWMHDLELEPNGVIWASLGVDGLGRYDGTSWMVWNHTNSPLISDYITEISLDPARHRIWGATYAGGLFYMEDEDLVMGTSPRAPQPVALAVYPVPSSYRVMVRAPGARPLTGTLEVIDALGGRVASIPFNGVEATFAVEGWSRGAYAVCLTGDQFHWTGRMVVE